MVIKILRENSRTIMVRPDPEPPGLYPVGRGDTIIEALGNFLIQYQKELNLTIEVDSSAVPDEMARRTEALKRR